MWFVCGEEDKTGFVVQTWHITTLLTIGKTFFAYQIS